MSNTENDPVEQMLSSEGRRDETDTSEVLLAREVPLGGPRGMLVRRSLPNKARRMVGAWCFADAYGPEDVGTGSGMQVPPHPHMGLQTVSWLLAGEVLHRDSLGSEHVIRPGTLNLMTAADGIAHSEVSPPGHSPRLHGAQLWVALPDADRHTAPAFETHDDLPRLQMGDADITVILGTMAGRTSPATTYSPIVAAELVLRSAAYLSVALDVSFEHAVLALDDGLLVSGVEVPAGAMLYLAPGRTSVDVASGTAATTALVLGGTPFEEELVMWWNFVGRTHDDVSDARRTWQAERQLPAADRVRFGFVDGHGGFSLPAPELPGVGLRPRPRHRDL